MAKPKQTLNNNLNINNIPEGPYCGLCPFYTHRKLTKHQWKLFCKNHDIPLPLGSNRKSVEYCKYLNDFLSIQDGIKDCDIKEDLEEGENKHD